MYHETVLEADDRVHRNDNLRRNQVRSAKKNTFIRKKRQVTHLNREWALVRPSRHQFKKMTPWYRSSKKHLSSTQAWQPKADQRRGGCWMTGGKWGRATGKGRVRPIWKGMTIRQRLQRMMLWRVWCRWFKSPNEDKEWVLRLKEVRSGFGDSSIDGGVPELGDTAWTWLWRRERKVAWIEKRDWVLQEWRGRGIV